MADLDTLIVFLQLLAGLALLYFGGELLVRGAVSLASRLGMSSLAIGLTVVAFGTSTPEMVVSVDAALVGSGDIALGNVVGSNIANITLILGFSALIRPARVESKVVRLDSPLMVLISLALLLVLVDGYISRMEGVLLIAALVAYVVFTFMGTRTTASAAGDAEERGDATGQSSLPVALALVAAGLVLLVFGGRLVVDGAIAVAQSFSMTEAAIGLTIVAVGTSLPELSTSIVAAMRGQGDIAVGNVVGSNIFNILGILGITTLIRPLRIGAITWPDLWLMVAAAVALSIVLYLRNGVRRPEGGVLVAAFIAYTCWLLFIQSGL